MKSAFHNNLRWLTNQPLSSQKVVYLSYKKTNESCCFRLLLLSTAEFSLWSWSLVLTCSNHVPSNGKTKCLFPMLQCTSFTSKTNELATSFSQMQVSKISYRGNSEWKQCNMWQQDSTTTGILYYCCTLGVANSKLHQSFPVSQLSFYKDFFLIVIYNILQLL